MTTHHGLGSGEYARVCHALGVTPDLSLPPMGRQAAVAGLTIEAVATPPAVERIRAWVAAGRPPVTADSIVRRMRFTGSSNTRAIIQNHLLTDAIAMPAKWYLIERVATVAVGSDAAGFALAPPEPRIEWQAVILDRSLESADILSVWLHEVAHAFLLPRHEPLDDEVTAAALSINAWRVAANEGLLELALRQAATDERQASRLARAWGGTGLGTDAERCAQGAIAHASRELARGTGGRKHS